MTDETQASNEEAVQQLYEFVVAEMQAGSERTAIAKKLVDQGVERSDAEQITNSIYDEVAALVQKEQFKSSALVPGAIGGLIGALIGGGVWAGIAVLTDYEIGIIAWGIGALCGFGTTMLAQNRKGVPLQVVAVLTSVVGIVLGKYFTFYSYFKDAMVEEYGAEEIAELSPLSVGVIQYFVDVLPQMASGYDVLWIVLAVYTAWKIPKASGITLNSPVQENPITPG